MKIKRLNLLPTEWKPPRPAEVRKKLALRAAAIGAVGLLPLSALYQFKQIHETNQTLNRLQTQNSQLDRQIRVLSQADQQRIEQQKFYSSLETLQKTKPHWSAIFKQISLVVPESVWLTKLDNGVDPKKSEIVLTGEAPDQQSVANLMASLEALAAFKSVKIKYSEALPGYTPELYRFQLECELKQGALNGKAS